MDLSKIVNNPMATLVDVRETYEFQASHAPGAINIPLGSIFQRIEEFKKMSAPIVVYCRSGNRSEHAKLVLQAKDCMGFTTAAASVTLYPVASTKTGCCLTIHRSPFTIPLMFNFLKKLFGGGSSSNLSEMLAQGAIILDVRSGRSSGRASAGSTRMCRCRSF
ncbi:MAG: rhodanese-like domain-containing protein [Saprospiraceae bacterium]|nr:rhodanese-like domain-containing protein [Saprospiraceae bacterium]